jgi:hypothetical protein
LPQRFGDVQPKATRSIQQCETWWTVIHTVPRFLSDFRGWSDESFRQGDLDAYDRKWSERSGLALRQMYERALRRAPRKRPARGSAAGGPR